MIDPLDTNGVISILVTDYDFEEKEAQLLVSDHMDDHPEVWEDETLSLADIAELVAND